MHAEHSSRPGHAPEAWAGDPGPWPGDPRYRTLAAGWDRQRRRLVEYHRAMRDLERDIAAARRELDRLARLANGSEAAR